MVFVSPGSICMFLLENRIPKPCAMSSSCSTFVTWKYTVSPWATWMLSGEKCERTATIITSTRCPLRSTRASSARFTANGLSFLSSGYTVNGFSFSARSEEHTSELQSQFHLVCRLLLGEKKHEAVDALSDLGAAV